MTGGALRTMTALYQATWDERYLKLAQRMAEFCHQNQNEQGVIRFDDVYMLPGMFMYYQATGDERMKDLILRCMRYQAWAGRDEADPRSFGFYGLSMAYFMTGDPSFLPWAERWKRDFVQCVMEGDDPFWFGKPKEQWDYCYLTLHLLYMPYYLEALATLEKPVQPNVLDNAVTSGEIVSQREDTKPFRVAAEWFCYAHSHFSGVTIERLDRYLARRPTRARLVLSGPGGEEVASAPVLMSEGQRANKAAINSPELPGRAKASQDKRNGRVALDVPAGPPGTYRLGIEDPGDLHFKLRLASSGLPKWAYTTQDEYLACADAYYFYVPADVEEFELTFKTLALRRIVEFAVYDPSGQVRKREQVEFAADPPAKYTVWSFKAEPAQRGKLWRFCVSPAHPLVERTYLRFKNVPPIVWTNAEAFFQPDKDALRARPRPAPMAVPYADAGEGLRIEAGKPLVIPRGERLADGRYKNIFPQQGTLEFWFRPEWALDDLADHTIVSCGQLRLYRRSQLGTYVSLGGGTYQSGFTTEPGRWYHLAVTWNAGGPGREPKTRLFINGLDMTGQVLSAPRNPLGDWTGQTITIGGGVACTIDDLRISDTVRYDGDFPLPSAPPSDEHALVRMTF
jgi:hypothetical protein